MYTAELSPQLNELLGTTIADFDMPSEVHARAVARYTHLASYLAGYWPDAHAGGEIYPQGSIRLGTTVAPITRRGEFDVDLVCRRDLLSTSITKEELKSDVGNGLLQYIATGPDGLPSRKEGSRCWTLVYPGEPFHMDILPALPDVDEQPHGILLADKGLRPWQPSSPIDFADWFRDVMRTEFRILLEDAAVAKRMEVEEVPDWEVKTTLQRTVQALKRHRDLHFASNPDDKPASIIITTLAARAYRGQGSLYEVLVDVVQTMTDYIEERNGVTWIANPVHEKENFADRWAKHPERERLFYEWIEKVQSDFAGIGSERGLDTIIRKLSESFGMAEATNAGDGFGQRMLDRRERGVLAVGGVGATLGAERGARVRPHTFHGDYPKPHRS